MSDEVVALRQRVAALEEELAYWRDEVRQNSSAEAIRRLRGRFGLTPNESWIVDTLYQAGGRMVRTQRLSEDMPGKDWEERGDGPATCRVLIHRIRRKMGVDSVTTVVSLGYILSERGLAAVREAIGDCSPMEALVSVSAERREDSALSAEWPDRTATGEHPPR